jgi:hypothetical protein
VLALSRPTPFFLLFACPFLGGGAFVALLLIPRLFGRERLRIGPGGLDYRRDALVTLGRRHIPLAEVQAVAPTNPGSVRTEKGLKIETLGKPVRFAQGVGPGERLWLADLLQRHLQALIPDRTIPLRGGAVGRFVEVLRPEQDFRWPLLLYLIPFGVIGLGIFLVWLAVLTAPLDVREWAIRPGEVEVRSSFLGLGRSRHHETRLLGRIELRRSPRDEGDSPYSLGLVGKGAPTCS